MAVVVMMVIVIVVMMMVVIVGMLMVVVATGNMIVVDVHNKFLLAGFSMIIILMSPNVKTFIFADYPPGSVAPEAKKWYNARRKEARPMSEHDHAYPHEHQHSHTHGHVHEHQRAVVNRLARAIGHLNKVKRMVEEGCDCADVLVQLAAVRSALDNTGKVILADHIRHCMVDAVQAGDESAIDDLCSAIDKFMK